MTSDQSQCVTHPILNLFITNLNSAPGFLPGWLCFCWDRCAKVRKRRHQLPGCTAAPDKHGQVSMSVRQASSRSSHVRAHQVEECRLETWLLSWLVLLSFAESESPKVAEFFHVSVHSFSFFSLCKEVQGRAKHVVLYLCLSHVLGCSLAFGDVIKGAVPVLVLFL